MFMFNFIIIIIIFRDNDEDNPFSVVAKKRPIVESGPVHVKKPLISVDAVSC